MKLHIRIVPGSPQHSKERPGYLCAQGLVVFRVEDDRMRFERAFELLTEYNAENLATFEIRSVFTQGAYNDLMLRDDFPVLHETLSRMMSDLFNASHNKPVVQRGSTRSTPLPSVEAGVLLKFLT